MSKKQPINKRQAIQRMRDLSNQNIPFSFGFITCNTSNKTSKGYKVIEKGMLRQGYRDNQSSKANTLIGYVDFKDNGVEKNRQFHYALLMMFNGQIVQP